jgi:hypothetical protein
LGGAAKTLMFANVSPASFNRSETENALKFASAVKMVTNEPTKNIENREILKLQKDLATKLGERDKYKGAVQ